MEFIRRVFLYKNIRLSFRNKVVWFSSYSECNSTKWMNFESIITLAKNDVDKCCSTTKVETNYTQTHKSNFLTLDVGICRKRNSTNFCDINDNIKKHFLKEHVWRQTMEYHYCTTYIKSREYCSRITARNEYFVVLKIKDLEILTFIVYRIFNFLHRLFFYDMLKLRRVVVS